MLINPPVYDFALYDLFLRPYGLLRIGRWLQEGGYNIVYINALDTSDPATAAVLRVPKRKADGTGKFFRQPVQFPEELDLDKNEDFHRKFARYGIVKTSLETRVASYNPDIVLISSGMTYWYKGVVEIVQIVQKTHPGIPVVVGGTYATIMPDHCREKTGADCVFAGSGPEDLAAEMTRRALPSPLDGSIVSAGTSGFPLPFPEKQYWGDSGVLRLNEGCPFQCDYCASHVLCPQFVPGDAEGLYHHFEEMYGSGIRNFAFYDDALLANKETGLFPFLQRVIAGPCSPSFFLPNAVHVHLLDRETAEMLEKASFREVRLGFESASEDFHNAYDRKFSMDSFGDAVENLKTAGFDGRAIGVYILAGLPGQSWEEVEGSIRYAASSGVKIYIAEFSPVPATSLWEECVANSDLPLEDEPLFHNNTFFPMEWEGFRERDLRKLKDQVREYNRALSTEP